MLHLSNSVCRQSKAYVNTLPRNVRNGTSNSTHTRGGKDFRPSWVYLASHILTYSVIPSVGLYCVFVVDWGKDDHVFMPPRRWLARQKAAFFSLSPAEQELAKSNEDHEKQQ